MNAAHATASGVFARRNKSRLKDLIELAEKLLSERTVNLETSSQPPSSGRCKLTASGMIEAWKNHISHGTWTGGDAGRVLMGATRQWWDLDSSCYVRVFGVFRDTLSHVRERSRLFPHSISILLSGTYDRGEH